MAEEYQGEGTFDLQALSIQLAKSGGFNVVASKQGTGGNPGQSKRVDLQDVVDVSMIAPPYSEGIFAKGDLVSREGKLYAAKEMLTIGESTPFDPSKWDEVVLSNLFGFKVVYYEITPVSEIIEAINAGKVIVLVNDGVPYVVTSGRIWSGNAYLQLFAGGILSVVTISAQNVWAATDSEYSTKDYVDGLVGDVESLLAAL